MGTSTGLVSGLDIESLVTQLMAVERRPVDKLEDKVSAKQKTLTIFSDLRSKLSSLRTAAGKLNTIREFRKYTATTTDTDDEHFTVSADSTSSATNHTVKINSVAVAEKEASQGFAEITSEIATGTFKIQLGSGDWQEITIDETNNTLEGLRNEINALDLGITATLMNDGSATPYRLLLSSDETGTTNSIQVDTSGMSGGDVPTFTETTTAADAEVVFDGVTINSASNEIEDIVSGVDLDLKLADVDKLYTIKVESNVDGIMEDIKDFVEKYNETMEYLTDKSDSTNDATIARAKRDLRSTLYNASDNTGAFKTLARIGISTLSDGTLSVDSEDLEEALEDNFSDVLKLLTAYGETTNSGVSFLNSRSMTVNGTYDVVLTGVGDELAGTIGGYAAVASGSGILRGAEGTPVEGLSLYVTAKTPGNYGTITFNSGIFDALDKLIETYTNTVDGLIKTKEEAINSQIDELETRIESKDALLDKTEARLRAKFTQMELSLQQLQMQSGYLSSI